MTYYTSDKLNYQRSSYIILIITLFHWGTQRKTWLGPKHDFSLRNYPVRCPLTREPFLCLLPKVTWLTFYACHLFSSVCLVFEPLPPTNILQVETIILRAQCTRLDALLLSTRGHEAAPSTGSAHTARSVIPPQPVLTLLGLALPWTARTWAPLLALHPKDACDLGQLLHECLVNQLI